ncbi:hypothetical protein OHA98_20845 [Streptomyces sp. NBC_00654]|uniref:hypothetical protein n=1 Tax=Streptomyces sp. NBC_00654 TaxID=2975799 RepID=UPI00225892B9|nr:hypothetical protein [Streptomyces sp. NBC_00654]MCX4967182.1 hypothetical protein [Streptomyces sp. NBC_00654]
MATAPRIPGRSTGGPARRRFGNSGDLDVQFFRVGDLSGVRLHDVLAAAAATA